jgi:hypothetical protein
MDAFFHARVADAAKKKTSAEVKGLFYATFPNLDQESLDDMCRYAFETTHPGEVYEDSYVYPSYVFGSTWS